MGILVLLTVLQTVGTSRFIVQRIPYQYRKQTHDSIIDLLIATPSYTETWETQIST